MLYRFNIELSDIDRNVYETLDFRVSQHPSENSSYLLTRVLAYALRYQEGLEFSPKGLGDPDAPALQLMGKHNSIDLWIEIGNPSPRKLHKASKIAARVCVYTYKNADLLVSELKSNQVHRSEDLQIYSFSESFISSIEDQIEKNNHWTIVIQENQISLSTKDKTIVAEIKKHQA
jgi:uncharacterized protein YaeQ